MHANPRSFDVMMEPTIASDGHTYEKTAILEWLSTRSVSPITGETMDKVTLIPNHLVRSQIRSYLSNFENA
jgi:hypothetical protein